MNNNSYSSFDKRKYIGIVWITKEGKNYFRNKFAKNPIIINSQEFNRMVRAYNFKQAKSSKGVYWLVFNKID